MVQPDHTSQARVRAIENRITSRWEKVSMKNKVFSKEERKRITSAMQIGPVCGYTKWSALARAVNDVRDAESFKQRTLDEAGALLEPAAA